MKTALIPLLSLLLSCFSLPPSHPREMSGIRGGGSTTPLLCSIVSGTDLTDESLDADSDDPDDESCLLETVALYPNDPNPFNPVTEIAFDLPDSMRVDVAVFDILGQPITTLANGQLPAGHHTVYFDGGKLPAGSYFCTLTAPGVMQTEKMMLVK